jgi:hypothetical protein
MTQLLIAHRFCLLVCLAVAIAKGRLSHFRGYMDIIYLTVHVVYL